MGVVVTSWSEVDPCQCSPRRRRCQGPPCAEGHLRRREVPPKCVCGAEVGGVGLVGPSRTWDGAPNVEIRGDPFFSEKTPKGHRGSPKWSRDAPPNERVGLGRGD